MNKIFKSIGIFFKKFFKVIGEIIVIIFNSTKFLFRIPILSLFASILTVPLIMVFKIFINMLPDHLNVGFIESLVAAIIFIILNSVFYDNDLKTKDDFDPKKNLLYFLPTIIIWAIPVFFLEEIAADASSFLLLIDIPPLSSMVFIAFYGSHLWLATLMQNFVLGTALGLVINSLIYFIRSYIVVHRTLYVVDKDDKKEEIYE